MARAHAAAGAPRGERAGRGGERQRPRLVASLRRLRSPAGVEGGGGDGPPGHRAARGRLGRSGHRFRGRGDGCGRGVHRGRGARGPGDVPGCEEIQRATGEAARRQGRGPGRGRDDDRASGVLRAGRPRGWTRGGHRHGPGHPPRRHEEGLR